MANTPSRFVGTDNRERKSSDSTLLNNSSIQHGYGSLGIFHTPPLPGGDHTPHTHTPPSPLNNDDFLLLNNNNNNNDIQEYATLPFQHQSFTMPQQIAMTPQQSGGSASSASSYSQSPSYSNTDYFKYNRNNLQKKDNNNKENQNENQIYQYQHPYFCNLNNPIYNDMIDQTEKTPHSINGIQLNYHHRHYSNALNKMSTNNNIQQNIESMAITARSSMNNSSFFRSPFDGFDAYSMNKSRSNLLPMIYILDATIGLAYLSQPYAIAHGGWTAIVGFIIIVFISYHCCWIYIKIFSHPSSTESFSYPSYPQLGYIIAGGKAYYLILIFSVCECIGICCVYILFLWNNVYYLLCRFQIYGLNGFIGNVDHKINIYNQDNQDNNDWSTNGMSEKDEIIVISICIITILPSILIIKIPNWLSYLTLIGVIIMGLSLFTFIILHIVISHGELAHHSLEQISPPTNSDNNNGGWNYWATNFAGFSISMGIFLFCFTSNSYSKLPLIQKTTMNAINNTQIFGKILRRSFCLLFIMYVFIGVCGYLLYGKSAHSIILRNMMQHCQNRIGIFCDLICIFFVITCWGSVSPLTVKISEFIEQNIIYEWLRNKRQQQCAAHIAQNYSIQTIQNYYLQQQQREKHKNSYNRSIMYHGYYQTNYTQKIESIDIIDSIDSINTLSSQHPSILNKENKDKNDDQDKNNKHNTNLSQTTTYLTSNSRKNTSFEEHTTTYEDSTVYITNTIKRICRTTVFIILLLISWMCRNHITFLESIVGICFSTVTCMILPCLLYLKAFWNTLSGWNKVKNILLTVIVIISGTALFIGCVIDLIAKHDVANKL